MFDAFCLQNYWVCPDMHKISTFMVAFYRQCRASFNFTEIVESITLYSVTLVQHFIAGSNVYIYLKKT